MRDLRLRAIATAILLAVAIWLAKTGQGVEAFGVILALVTYFVTPVVEAASAGEPLASRLPSPLFALRHELVAFLAFWVAFGAFLLWKEIPQ